MNATLPPHEARSTLSRDLAGSALIVAVLAGGLYAAALAENALIPGVLSLLRGVLGTG